MGGGGEYLLTKPSPARAELSCWQLEKEHVRNTSYCTESASTRQRLPRPLSPPPLPKPRLMLASSQKLRKEGA